MMNYFMLGCQTKKSFFRVFFLFFHLFFLFFVAGCGEWDVDEDIGEEKEGLAWKIPEKLKWFDQSLRDYRYFDEWQHDWIHPFYDLESSYDRKTGAVSFFVLTPEKSSVLYDFDILSGRRFLKHPLCPQVDIWKKKESIDLPPYTEGIIPRVLNGVARPQRIFVFGGRSLYEEALSSTLFQARIVGAIIRQEIFKESSGTVLHQSGESSLILLAVSAQDSSFEKVETLEDLKSKVDFDEVKAFAENGDGVRFYGGVPHGAFRVVGEVKKEFILNSFYKKETVLTDSDLFPMQKGCLDLYDHLWENVGVWKWKLEELLAKKQLISSLKENKKIKAEQEKKFLSDTIYYQQRANYLKNFFESFKSFHQKFGAQYLRCIRYVKGMNGGPHVYKHWFLAYMEMYYHLIELGYVFDCNAKDWYYKNSSEEALKSSSFLFSQCFLSDIDRPFIRGRLGLKNIQSVGGRYYRYLEYDQGPYATHARFYTWVLDLGTRPYCDISDEKRLLFDKQLMEYKKIFPSDIEWTPFAFKASKVVY